MSSNKNMTNDSWVRFFFIFANRMFLQFCIHLQFSQSILQVCTTFILSQNSSLGEPIPNFRKSISFTKVKTPHQGKTFQYFYKRVRKLGSSIPYPENLWLLVFICFGRIQNKQFSKKIKTLPKLRNKKFKNQSRKFSEVRIQLPKSKTFYKFIVNPRSFHFWEKIFNS